MNHYAAIASALEAENLDAVLLTGEANRFYASGFFTPGTDATALVTRQDAVFFTDARYTEAASRRLDGAELREVKPGKGLADQLKEQVFLKGIRRLGIEDAVMSVQSFRRLKKALSEKGRPTCELVGASEPILKLRQTKDAEELQAMETAQGIAERALEDILAVSVDCFQADDPAAARKVEPLEETIDQLTDEIRARHVHRLQNGECTIQLGFVLNDLLTNLDFEAMYLHHIGNGADLTVAAVPYTVSVPFAIMNIEGDVVKGLREKPTYNYFANAGVYMMRTELLRRIPADTYVDAPDFISSLIGEGGKVGYFPIEGTWIDIGSPDDFRYANGLMSTPRR